MSKVLKMAGEPKLLLSKICFVINQNYSNQINREKALM